LTSERSTTEDPAAGRAAEAGEAAEVAVMRIPVFPAGAWSASPLQLFHGQTIQAQLEEGDWIAGVLRVGSGGVEIVYDEPRAINGCVESSRLLDDAAARRLRVLLRPAALWTDELKALRAQQIWRAAHPTLEDRCRSFVRAMIGRDPLAAEPLLRAHVGRRILLRVERRNRSIFTSGLLVAFDRDFVALADTVVPGETVLPLCPGRTLSVDLQVQWNDDGLELFNRGAEPLEILGVRTSEGTRPWEILLRPGARERIGFRRAPAGTAELLYERPERGDAILPRGIARILGGSEGSVTLPALPDPSTLMRDLPIGTTPESREEPPVPVITDDGGNT
jgi:hypothetical protein